MEFIQLLFLLCSATATIFMIIGLYKPWIMLWWEDVQTRKKVIKLYGTVAIFSYIVYWFLILAK